mgnify:CR=1 FL=1
MGTVSDNEIERIRRDHIADPDGDPNDPHCAMCSDASYPIWPCDAAHLLALLAERDAEIARLREALELELQDEINAILKGGSALTAAKGQAYIDQSPYVQRLRAALAARGGEADAAH